MGKKTKNVNKSKATGTGAVPDAALVKGLQEQGSLLPLLRLQWSLAGKDEWWWVMDDSVAEIARQIKTKNYCVFDGFLGPERSALLERDVKEAHRRGLLSERGHLAGGKTGQNLTYVKEGVRDDWLGWFDGDGKGGDDKEKGFEQLPSYMLKVQTLVSELKPLIPELATTNSRSRAMLTCYPGEGSRYIRHVDNGNENGRKLTAIMYLNPDWKDGDGGELRIFRENSDEVVEDVPPVRDRLLLFWSDARVPHEVLPSRVARYAVTLWFFDTEERRRAEASDKEASVVEQESERIRKEMEKFHVSTPPQLTTATTPSAEAEGPLPPPQHESSATQESDAAEAVEESRHHDPSSATEGACCGVAQEPSMSTVESAQDLERPSSTASSTLQEAVNEAPLSHTFRVRPRGSDAVTPYIASMAADEVEQLVVCIATPPGLTTLKAAELDVGETGLAFTPMPNHPTTRIQFPFPVDASGAKARFVKNEGAVHITLSTAKD